MRERLSTVINFFKESETLIVMVAMKISSSQVFGPLTSHII